MAINKNKVQLQETVLDSNGHPLSSTDVNPLTSSDCVIMENGMTLEDVMGNDTVIDTPTIMNEDTSFKVGIGDSETKVIDSDVAKMVIEGKTYQNILPNPTTLIMNTDEKEFKINDKIDSSIVLDDNVAEIATVKGQTYVNVVQEESASEYTVLGEDLSGQSITHVKETPTLEGQTLVNLQPGGGSWHITNAMAYYDIMPNFTSIKTNTQYMVKFFNKPNYVNKMYLSNATSYGNLTNSDYAILTTSNALAETQYIHCYGNDDVIFVQSDFNNVQVMLLEYQEGMENWDIPYFEGEKYFESNIKGVTLQGQTLVNTIQEPCKDDYVVLGADDSIEISAETGGHGTIENTVQGGINGAILKGNTLVNLLDYSHSYPNSSHFTKQINGHWSISVENNSKPFYLYNPLNQDLKDNTLYTIIVDVTKNNLSKELRLINGYTTGKPVDIPLGYIGKLKIAFTTNSSLANGWNSQLQTVVLSETTGEIELGDYILLEGDYTNIDIPYFEGMQSVKMPVLTTTGKNLLDKTESYNATSICGVQVTTLGTNTFRLNGTVTKVGDIALCGTNSFQHYVKVKPNTTYKAVLLNENNSVIEELAVRTSNDDGSSVRWRGGTFTTNSNETKVAWIRITFTDSNIGKTYDNITVKAMLIETSKEVGEFEPYQSSTVTTINLAKGAEADYAPVSGNNGTTSTGYRYVKNQFYSYVIPVKPNTTYYVKTSGTANRCAIGQFVNKPVSVGPNATSSSYYVNKSVGEQAGEFTFTTLSTTNYIALYCYNHGSVATDAEFKTIIDGLHVTFCEVIELRKVGDVQDELDLTTGKLTQRIGEVILDGSETWVLGTTKEKTQVFFIHIDSDEIINMKKNTTILCDKLKVTSGIDEEIIILTNSIYLGLLKSKASTVEELKVYLSQNPITIQYKLATPNIKTVDLTVTDQDGNTIPHIQTQPTVTHITASSNHLIPTVTIDNNLAYDTIIKPSTLYTVRFNHDTVNTDNPLTVDLGGTTQTVTSTEFTITTPSELTHNQLVFSGKNNVVSEVQVIEGDVTNIEYPFFEGMSDVKSPKLLAAGKNLFDYSSHPITLEKLAYTDGQQVYWTGYIGVKTYVPVKENTTYTYSNDINVGINFGLVFYDDDKSVLSYINTFDTNIGSTSFTTPKGCKFIRFAMETQTIPQWIQLEEGSTATSYEPYKGVTIEQSIDSIPLTSDMFEQGGFKNENNIKGMSLQQYPLNATTTRIRAKTLIKVKPNTRYLLKNKPNTLYKGWCLTFDKNGDYTGLNIDNLIDFTTNYDVYYIAPVLNYVDDSTITPSDLDSLNLTLQEVPQEIVLRGIGDVKDELDLTRGEYIQRIGEITYDGSNDEYWRNEENNTTYAICKISLPQNVLGHADIPSSCIKCDNIMTGVTYKESDGKEQVSVYRHKNNDTNTNYSELRICLPISYLPSVTVQDFRNYIKNHPFKVQYQLETPIIKKVNLTNATKLPSYTSTTHYDTIVPSNSLVPNIKIPSTIDYNVAIKPSTQYTIRANTTSAMSVNLGGSTGTLTNGKVTLTTPSTLAHNSLKLGNGKAKEVMVIEGSEIKDNVPFFNGMKNVQMGGIKLVNIARYKSHANGVNVNANKTVFTYTSVSSTGAWGNIEFDKSLLKTNTVYTVYLNVVTNNSDRSDAIKISLGNDNDEWIDIPNTFIGIFKTTFKTNDIKDQFFGIYFRNPSTSGQQVVIQNPMIIEGDWTHLDEIPFIESEMIIEQPIIRSQGKNLFDMTTLKTKKNYGNQIKSLDGQKVVFTTAGEWSGVSSGWMKLKPNTTYTFGGEKSRNEIKLFYRLRLNNGDVDSAKTAKTFTTQNSGEVIFNFETSVSDNVDNTVSNVYLYEGNITSPSYEPYKHQTLYSNRVIGYEENCYYANGGGFKLTNTGVNSMLADVEGLSIAYVTGGSSEYTFWDKDNVFISGKQYLDTSSSSFDKNGFIAIPPNAKYMRFAAGGETNAQPLYKVATVTGELPLRSLPNGVCDSFNLVTGEYVQRVGEVVLDGSENWNVNSIRNSTILMQMDLQDKKVGLANLIIENIYYERYVYNSDKNGYSGGEATNRIYIGLNKDKLLTQDTNGFKQYLSQNPITVQYELETPIVRKIGLTAKGNYKEVELNGSENWISANADANNTICTRYYIPSGQSINSVAPNMIVNSPTFSDYIKSRKYQSDSHGQYEYVSVINEGLYLQIYKNKLLQDSVSEFKQWLSQHPMKVGYLTNQSATSYSNISKPIFFSNVNVQFMNNNIDIQPTLTLQARSTNSYVLDNIKPSTQYTSKFWHSSYTTIRVKIDNNYFNISNNTTFNSPSTLTNKLLVVAEGMQELMIIEGDVTGKQLPYYKGIRSSFDNTDKVEAFVRNKNLVKELYPMLNNNTCVIENGVITIKGNGDGSGELNYVFNPSIYLEKDKTYTFSFSSDAQFGKTNGTDTVEAFLLKDGGTGYYIEAHGFTKVFTCGATGYYNIRLDINKNNTTHKFYNIQIEESPTATPYQPHEENSTIINMPMQLETVEVVKVDMLKDMETGAINPSGVNTDSANRKRSIGYISVQPNQKIVVNRSMNIFMYDINKNLIEYQASSNNTFTPDNCYFIRFYCDIANTNNITITKQQYKPIALNELPNGVKDELIINRATSSAKLIKRVGKIVLDGSEDWLLNTYHENTTQFVAHNIIKAKNATRQEVICDKLQSVTDNDVIVDNSVWIYNSSKLVIHHSSSTSKQLKDWLKQNPITVYYELAEPVITEIRLKGYPFIYEDGNITLNTDIAPVTRTSYNVNQHQLINSQNETIIRHDKQISDLYDYIEIYLDEIYRMELFKMQLELSL